MFTSWALCILIPASGQFDIEFELNSDTRAIIVNINPFNLWLGITGHCSRGAPMPLIQYFRLFFFGLLSSSPHIYPGAIIFNRAEIPDPIVLDRCLNYRQNRSGCTGTVQFHWTRQCCYLRTLKLPGRNLCTSPHSGKQPSISDHVISYRPNMQPISRFDPIIQGVINKTIFNTKIRGAWSIDSIGCR